MNKEDKVEFAELMAALARAFKKEADGPFITAYRMGLSDLTIEEIEAACTRAINEVKFLPVPVELRALAGRISPTDRALMAWERVAKTMEAHGGYASVDFDDPIVNATIRNLGGWRDLCLKPTDEVNKWYRKDFERVYAALCGTGISAEATRYLPGNHEASNCGEYEIEPPKRIAVGLPEHSGIVAKMLKESRKDKEIVGKVMGSTAVKGLIEAVGMEG